MIRRILGAATRTLPLLLVLFVPIVLGMKQIYSWANPEVVAHDELIQAKTWYLNTPGWIARFSFPDPTCPGRHRRPGSGSTPSRWMPGCGNACSAHVMTTHACMRVQMQHAWTGRSGVAKASLL